MADRSRRGDERFPDDGPRVRPRHPERRPDHDDPRRDEWGRQDPYPHWSGRGPHAGRFRAEAVDEAFHADYGDFRPEGWRGRFGGPRRGGERRAERDWWDRAADEVASWFGDEEAERRRFDDRRGAHRGRGPRGHVRSDERIAEDVHDRMTDDSYLDASDIEVAVAGGEVTLSGTVDSRAAKRRAEDIVDTVSGVGHCQNNLRVRAG